MNNAIVKYNIFCFNILWFFYFHRNLQSDYDDIYDFLSKIMPLDKMNKWLTLKSWHKVSNNCVVCPVMIERLNLKTNLANATFKFFLLDKYLK